MKLGEKGTELIQSFEKLRLTAYPDTGGVWTIGWGHTGPEVREGLTWSKQFADETFIADSEKAVAEVTSCLNGLGVLQQQFDALVSFEFNTGGLRHSTLLKKLLAGDLIGAATEFPRWNKDNGKVLAGLTRRRLAEQALFTSF